MSVEIQICVAKIQGLINGQGKLAEMLVETGSSVTIVSETMTKGCELSPSGAVTVSSATGDSVPIIGKCDFEFRIGQKISVTYTAFVSRNFLKDRACFIDVANDSLYINGKSVSFSSDVSPFSESMQDACGYESLNGIEISENVTSDEKFTSSFHTSNTLDELECTQIYKVLGKFRHTFAFNDNELGRTNLVEHSAANPYRIPHSQRNSLENQIESMCTNGIIQPSKSPYCAPIVLVAQERRQGTNVHRFSQNKRGDEKGRLPSSENRRHIICAQ